MKIRKIATIALLVISSFAANGVAPSKTELEAMYDKAFREFDGNNYDQALKDLDAIDARQPDLAESQNLRGVILMRQKDYANAEKALEKALAADPKFWNARFNLAEIPFLEKKWPEARKRFQELLNGNASELQGEATQLIQYKILITYLMEGKTDMVSAILAKFELTPESPAVQYANAAIALSKKNEKEAKDVLTAAEKNFSAQLNKLFAESLYEVGWLEKPAGQTRAALELNSAAERASQTKAFANAKYEQAEQALQQRDLTAARKLIDEADAADPNQAPILNLRGEVFLEQKEFAQAEAEFKKAQQADPNFRDAQYNLAQVPFKKKEYTTARDRFEALFTTTSGADKDRAAQLIKFKIYLTLLLEGKDSRAQKMMEQFQFTGDTPALYYAQAAWEFKHDNASKANDWVTSARKIYPAALNGVFADAFFDLGWLQSPALDAAAAPLVADATQPEVAPSIEPTPIPAMTLAQKQPLKTADPLTLAAGANSAVTGMEATTSSTADSSTASSALAAASSPSVETPVASTSSPAASRPVVASASEPDAISNTAANASAAAAASPATVLAPAKVREWSEPTLSERLEKVGGQNPWLIGALFLGSLLILSWVMIPALRRSFAGSGADRRVAATDTANFDEVESVGAVEGLVVPGRLAGGPPQVSLQLRASEPALRRAVMPLGKTGRTQGNGNGHSHGNGGSYGHPYGTAVATAVVPAQAERFVEPEPYAPATEEYFDDGVGEPVALVSDEGNRVESAFAEADFGGTVVLPEEEQVSETSEPTFETSLPESYENYEAVSWDAEAAPVSEETSNDEFAAPVVAQQAEAQQAEEFSHVATEAPAEPVVVTAIDESPALASDWQDEAELEPIGQGQPVPYLTSAADEENLHPISDQPASVAALGAGLAGIGALRHSLSPSSEPEAVSSELTAHQSTTPVTMPQPTQPTPAPVLRTAPPAGAAPQPTGGSQPAMPGGMHTAVQLTFSFEIASLQLTPSFKMGALQLKPTSKIVAMRLAPSQHPQPAMNLQVTFEIASVQLAGNSIGVIRLTPSQQQRPVISSSPSFNVAGLQLVAGADAAPVQITPSQQGQASVHVTAGFQIATVEFSPSFEIASIILNSTSRNVSVQLPGSGPSAVEGAPVFEIGSVQLGGNGEISTMQLNPQGTGAKRA
ncbi:MAG TPA: tetratricopeptide repeat protein [Chthoniobacterales bacterium]|nr:tetratricopeptide repeat protein [Chthoniobacterales bacterium]